MMMVKDFQQQIFNLYKIQRFVILYFLTERNRNHEESFTLLIFVVWFDSGQLTVSQDFFLNSKSSREEKKKKRRVAKLVSQFLPWTSTPPVSPSKLYTTQSYHHQITLLCMHLLYCEMKKRFKKYSLLCFGFGLPCI